MAEVKQHTGNDQPIADLESYGAPAEIVAAQKQRQQQTAVVFILPKNWLAVQAFLLVQIQLDSDGFNYAGVESGLRMTGIECEPVLFQKLRVLEFAALKALAE